MNNKSGASEKNNTEPVIPEWQYDAKLVENRLKSWFPELPADVVKKLVGFQSELLNSNKTVNLVSNATYKNIESLHVSDCLLAAKIIGANLISDAPLYDCGFGNGLPGIVFGILWPQRNIILIEKDRRKTEFCKHIASTLGLRNISVLETSIDALEEKSVLNAVSRGHLALPKALLAARKTVAKGGRFFHMKSDGWTNELGLVPSQLFSFWSPSLIGQYKLPETSLTMNVVLTDKTAD